MELVELGPLSVQDWLQLTGREREPFGATTAGLTFRPKDRHAAFRDRDGTLAAAVGATVATVRVGGGGPFEVVGIGGLIVRRDLRGRDLATPLMDRLRDMIDSLGPERAMLFCEEGLVAGYARRGYARIDAPVRVDQPGGRIEIPLRAMWRPLRPSTWPPGTVDLDGLPF